MKLSTRVLSYFLATLGIALVAYSLFFYSVVSRHLQYQFDLELQGVLHALVAAAEVEETEVKWQPLEHSVSFDALDDFDEVHWVVVGDKQRIVEKDGKASDEFVLDALQLSTDTAFASAGNKYTPPTNKYLFYYQHLSAPNPAAMDREPDEFDTLAIIAGRSQTKLNKILRKLAAVVIVLPLVAWLIVAALGRWIVRQALMPVFSIARQTNSISGDDFQSRIVVSKTCDEIQVLGTTINRLLDRQQAAFEQHRSFAANAAHELRTPVTVMLGQIDVTLRRVRSIGEYQRTLEVLRAKSLDFREIIESLLFLARDNGEGELPRRQRLYISDWLDQYFDSLKHSPRAADLRLVNNIRSGSTAVVTPTLLGRIMENLMSNAAKYSPPGTPIELTAYNEDSNVVLRVTDKGCGINDEDLVHVFEPFYRSSYARNLGVAGTGLGLALANRIALALGGRLSVVSRPGQGCSFSLTLPVSLEHANQAL